MSVRATAIAWLLLAGVVNVARAQAVRLEFYGVSVTDRHGAVLRESTPARGFGAGAGASLRLGDLTAEVAGYWAALSRESPSADWNALQGSARLRFRVIGPLALEGSVSGRALDPDVDGEEVGFVSAGVYATLPLASIARVWGRVGYIPFVRFSGTGSLGFAGEAQLGFDIALVGDRIRAVGQYQFQRIDRKLDDPAAGIPVTSPIEFDIAWVGIAFTL